MPRATIVSTAGRVSVAPPKRTVPRADPLAGSAPMMAASMVVLPAPFGPITVTIWPRGTSRCTFCSASTLPYATQRSRTWRTRSLTAAPRRGILHPERTMRPSLDPPEIRLEHLGIVLHLLRQALGDLLTEVHDVDAIDQSHHEVHVVLDEQDRQAFGPQLAQ